MDLLRLRGEPRGEPWRSAMASPRRCQPELEALLSSCDASSSRTLLLLLMMLFLLILLVS